MHSPHDGRIVTIDQLYFVSLDHCMIFDHPNSLNVTYIQVVSPPPQGNYVALPPIPSIANERDHLALCSYSLDSVPTVCWRYFTHT
jgi:hypothetical protein